MNELMAIKKVSSFETILAAYKQAGVSLHNAIDGGAGSGLTARAMLKSLGEGSLVYAFEPFPGNHRFFLESDTHIVLIPKALAQENKRMAFRVPSVVAEESVWGKRGMAGYSSVGFLIDEKSAGGTDLEVECVRADTEVPSPSKIGFVKLDLQGGELNALKGMTGILKDTALMWVEYSGQKLLLDYIVDQGFVVFDTEYFFLGSPSAEAKEMFEVSKENIVLSTGKTAWFGFRRKPWGSYEQEFLQLKKELRMIQTDLVCINKAFLNEFILALQYI